MMPTMFDRAMQALYLLALDPIAETTADRHSYGSAENDRRRTPLRMLHVLFQNSRRNGYWKATLKAASTRFLIYGF